MQRGSGEEAGHPFPRGLPDPREGKEGLGTDEGDPPSSETSTPALVGSRIGGPPGERSGPSGLLAALQQMTSPSQIRLVL